MSAPLNHDGLLKECELSDGLCPDVIEWCPVETCANILLYGTYKHVPDLESRVGAVHLCRLESAEAGASWDLRTVTTIDFAGVYDLAWGPQDGSSILVAVAVADGSLNFLKLDLEAAQLAATTESAIAKTGRLQVLDGIMTHITWGAGSAHGLGAVGQAGAVYHLQHQEGTGEAIKVAERSSHKLEAWSVEVSALDCNLLLSGADDGHVIGWDIRASPTDPPAVANRRAHEAGVTALACNPFQTQFLATGSYDEKVRIFDLRALGAHPLMESARLGDGAYHLAWHPHFSAELAVAGMRSGVPLFSMSGETELLEWGRYAADAESASHGSLAYGICWQATASSSQRLMAASACFQSQTVHVWSCEAPSQKQIGALGS
mmetsp:Transcript_68797/g.128367  ORF Transcript_68797/g.128367 Transcript_68797/m.128367 type:complete len:376 (+) Transcript_68797:28-1155(+)